MVKNVERDFTLIGQVPDQVKLEDCEVIIHKASVSYPSNSGTVTLEYDDEPGGKDEVEIVVLSTRFTDPDGGATIKED